MKKLIILSIFLLTGVVVACQKLTDVGNPVNNLISKSIFESNETAISAMTGIYARMLDDANRSPLTISWYSSLAADEIATAPSGSYLELFKNSPVPQNALTNTLWNGGYNFIYRSNAVIEGLQSPNGVGTEVKQHLLGEAYLIRAFWYFYLVNFYGDVPLILNTDYDLNSQASRTSVANVYKQIILDLEESKKLLPEKYVAGNTVTEVVDRVRPNTYTASALLARAYLYSGDFQKAESEATRIISKTEYYILEPASKVFLKASKEAIWQLSRPLPAPVSTFEGEIFILKTKPGSLVAGSTTLSASLVSSFKNNDLRNSTWVGRYTDNTVNPAKVYFFPFKYKTDGTSITAPEHSIVFRLAEQYLIRAEARAQLENYSGAISDIDAIRTRANQPSVSVELPVANKADLITIIQKERQLEMFLEYGHRWMDLKRSGKIDVTMQPASIIKGSKWETYMQLWPIPPTDINNSTHLIQNPGYN